MAGSLIHGVAHNPFWKQANHTTINDLHWLIEGMASVTSVYNVLVDATKARVHEKERPSSLDADKRRYGYTFIREIGPTPNNANQFIERIDDQFSDARIPAFGWSDALVKESLRHCATGKATASTTDRCPITLNRAHPIPMLGSPRHSQHYMCRSEPCRRSAQRRSNDDGGVRFPDRDAPTH